MTLCNACECSVHDDLIANTGGDTICLACHAECLPSDRDAVRTELLKMSDELIEDGGEEEWQQYFNDRQLQNWINDRLAN